MAEPSDARERNTIQRSGTSTPRRVIAVVMRSNSLRPPIAALSADADVQGFVGRASSYLCCFRLGEELWRRS
jgi:hypothetical protein